MTSVLLVRSGTGVLRFCRADGHADFAAAGTDIVCSAVTILLRTVMQTLSETPGVKLEADTSTRGTLSFSVCVEKPSPETDVRLVYAGDFLEQGIKSLEDEYPVNVKLQIQCGK
jgi:uncharacterized protein